MLHSYTILTFVVLFIYVRYLLVMVQRGTAFSCYLDLVSNIIINKLSFLLLFLLYFHYYL